MFEFRTTVCERFCPSSDEQTVKPQDSMFFCFESFERFNASIEMRVEQFNEIGVVGTVGDCFVREQFFPSFVYLQDNGLAQWHIFTTLIPDMMQSKIQFFIALVLSKDMFLE